MERFEIGFQNIPYQVVFVLIQITLQAIPYFPLLLCDKREVFYVENQMDICFNVKTNWLGCPIFFGW